MLRESVVHVHDALRLLLSERHVEKDRQESVHVLIPDLPLQLDTELEERVVVVRLLHEVTDLASLEVRVYFRVPNVDLLQSLE